ncbi:MAG: TrmB family transcriptional regulator [Deltaproteobacteria bacterium]|nr:TrmB family transcriptional regulator [Deltaproteobacteria bacterium]
MQGLLQRLREIGFGENEAKLYLALVKRHPASGYELARASGVPSSKVYEVLARLREKELVFVTDGGRATRYIPADSDEFVERYTRRMTRALDGLKQDLHALGDDDQVGYVWNVHARAELLERAIHLLARAERTVLLSAWDEELGALAGPIAAAHRRGVRIAVIDYGALAIEADAVYPHPIKDTIAAEKGGRGLTLCVDSRVALLGLVADGGNASGAWSSNHGFVAAVEDYLKHDIYVQKIVGRFHDLLVRTYGPNFARWRDVFADRVLPAADGVDPRRARRKLARRRISRPERKPR